MSRVWVMAGVVLVGTGLAIAAFGYWLTGNANCDAADLGRICVMASLATAVVGTALGVGGWMRVQRLGAGDEGTAREGAGWAPVAAIFAIMIAGTVLLTVASPVPNLPVGVYSHPAPQPDDAPESFLPADLAGHARASLVAAPGEQSGSVVAVATYAGELTVRITRFNASAFGGLSNATQAADDYLNSLYVGLDRSTGPSACAAPGEMHWYTHAQPGTAVLAWQRGNFVVQVTAPDTATRDAAAGALSL